jgi:hypothetical protein
MSVEPSAADGEETPMEMMEMGKMEKMVKMVGKEEEWRKREKKKVVLL